MKKLLAILLTAAMLLTAVPALAEGSTTDKAITFAEFNFGDTFGAVRKGQYLRSINFQRGMYSPRNLADAVNHIPDWATASETLPVCFSAEPDGMRKVAGHDCAVSLWFVYPVENGASVLTEAAATFYAGKYSFWEGDAKAIFEDLKQKLGQLYGAPYTEGRSLDGALGEADIPEERKDTYAEQTQRYDPTYVVWKSSANNAALVLKYCKQDGERERTELDYISLDAADVFARIETGSDGSTSNSMEGL